MESYFEYLSYDIVEIIYYMLDNFDDKDNFVLNCEYLTLLLACKLIKEKNEYMYDKEKVELIDSDTLRSNCDINIAQMGQCDSCDIWYIDYRRYPYEFSTSYPFYQMDFEYCIGKSNKIICCFKVCENCVNKHKISTKCDCIVCDDEECYDSHNSICENKIE
jgi:hypothetical protein